jgi:hypothetical protein
MVRYGNRTLIFLKQKTNSMKKFTILAILLLMTPALFAQNEEGTTAQQQVGEPQPTSKYFPTAGEIGIGLDAAPFLNYLGNMFNGSLSNSLNLNDQTLYFRYMIFNNLAARVSLLVNTSSNTDKFYVPDDAAQLLDPLSNKMVEDWQKDVNNEYRVTIGAQMYRGKNRLRGFYGADLAYSFTSSKTTYEYGNIMNENNPAPSTHWGNLTERNTLIKNGQTHSIGLGIFAGGEFFIMPRFCIGVELGGVFNYTYTGQSYREQEKMVNSLHVTETITSDPGEKGWSLNTTFPYMYSNLYLLFHF